jgi:alcohol dehydrogenase
MLLGAHLAGLAIEHSMLGAAHACANPLTARYGIAHGVAVGVMLPHVVEFNCAAGPNPYADLVGLPAELGAIIRGTLDAGGMARRLRDLGVVEQDLPQLAEMAARQWTAGFNPRLVGTAELLEIYRAAFG